MCYILTKFKNEFNIWLQWVFVTMIGFFLSLYWVEIGERSDIRAIEAVIGGIIIGLAQWLVLKQHFSQMGWWIFASMISWSLLAGSPLGALGWIVPKVMSIPARIVFGIIDGVIAGVIVGIGQWWVLKNQVKHAWLWILANVVGWAMGLTFAWTVGAVLRGVTGIFLGEVVGLTLGWLMVGAITGIVLCCFTKSATQNQVEVR